jgi:CRISPR-associated protein Cas1
VQAKIHNQKRLLQRLAANRSLSAAGSSAFLQSVQNQVANVRNLEALRGLEGVAAAHYFGAWAGFLPEAFPFERRSTCPPHNAVNACISFGGSLLYNECATAIHARGLDPALGLLHATENGRWSLALDLMEPFRPVVVEALTVDLFSHGMLGEGAFEPRNGGVYLSHEGRRVFLPQYERRMEREFDSRHCGHRTTLRKQLAEAVSRLKAAFENPDRFEPFEMN